MGRMLIAIAVTTLVTGAAAAAATWQRSTRRRRRRRVRYRRHLDEQRAWEESAAPESRETPGKPH